MATTVISNAEVLIHSDNASLPLIDIGEDEYFGILNLKTLKTKLVKTPTLIKFTIDKTGSMNEQDRNGHTKMHYVIETFVSMMTYLSTLDTDIFIQVNAFNRSVEELVKCVKISPDNLDEINNTIKEIECGESTDIGLAMNKANEELINYADENPGHQLAHVFMTDGEPTTGIISLPVLVGIVNESFNNIFIGFGLHHNVDLLSKMAEKKNAEYQFVDNMENTSLVYGETVHKFIYPAIRNVEIKIENGQLYDWQKNEWTHCLYEDIIIGEAEKVYHIKTIEPCNVNVYISGNLASVPETSDTLEFDSDFNLLKTAMSMPDLQDIDTGEIITNDLTKYAFRQKVQELLYRAKNNEMITKLSFKNELREAFRTIRKYMRLNQLLDDGLLKMLCDDIVITYRTFGKQHGRVFALARQATQGRQRTYNTSSSQQADDFDNTMIPRQNAFDISTIETDILSSPRPRLQRTNTAPLRHVSLAEEPICNQPSLYLSDELNDDPFKKYDQTGFFKPTKNMNPQGGLNSSWSMTTEEINPTPEGVDLNLQWFKPPVTVFKNLFEDDDFLPEDEIDAYMPSESNTTCYATPNVLNTMRTMSARKP